MHDSSTAIDPEVGLTRIESFDIATHRLACLDGHRTDYQHSSNRIHHESDRNIGAAQRMIATQRAANRLRNRWIATAVGVGGDEGKSEAAGILWHGQDEPQRVG